MGIVCDLQPEPRGEANFGWLAVVAGSLGRWGSDSLGQRAGDRVLWVAEQGIGSGGLELLPVATGCLEKNQDNEK